MFVYMLQIILVMQEVHNHTLSAKQPLYRPGHALRVLGA